jgi:hypothetical protein
MSVFLAFSTDDIASLLSRFKSERNLAAKEALMLELVQHHPDAGPQLLKVATSTHDTETRWLAIRGLGELKFRSALPFVIDSLSSPHHYVRANAARALGEMNIYTAAPKLIALLKTEPDNGVIEQTSLALQMIKARKALPVLKARADNVQNPQTECWLLGAITDLGGRGDVLFIAERLYDKRDSVALCAATDLQEITGENLQLGLRPGPFDPSAVISKAKNWWQSNAHRWH